MSNVSFVITSRMPRPSKADEAGRFYTVENRVRLSFINTKIIRCPKESSRKRWKDTRFNYLLIHWAPIHWLLNSRT